MREERGKASPGQLRGGGSLFVVSNAGNNSGHWETGEHSGTNDTEREGGGLFSALITLYPALVSLPLLPTQHAATLHPVSGEMIADHCIIIWPRNLARTLWLGPQIALNHKCNQIHLLLVTVGNEVSRPSAGNYFRTFCVTTKFTKPHKTKLFL